MLLSPPPRRLLLLVLLLLPAAAPACARAVSCTGIALNVSAAQLDLYDPAFTAFEDAEHRSGRDALAFDLLAWLAAAAHGGADVAEMLVTARALAGEIAPVNVSVAAASDAWRQAWSALAAQASAGSESESEREKKMMEQTNERRRRIEEGGRYLLEKFASKHLLSFPFLLLSYLSFFFSSSPSSPSSSSSSSFFRFQLAAEGMERRGRSAASALLRAAMTQQLALRFSDHRTPAALAQFNESVAWFDRALALRAPGVAACSPVRVPMVPGPGQMYAYWCGAGPGAATVVALSGFDGSNQNTYFEVGAPAALRGFNVLMLEGPGQGMTARFEHLPFRPDYGVVLDSALAWLQVAQPAVNVSRVVLWGRSFGGYLAPRAAATATHAPAALVADGGVFDFFQSTFCALPAALQPLLASNPAKFDEYMLAGMNVSLAARSLLYYGFLGFNTSSPAELYTHFQAFTMAGLAARLAPLPMLVNAPAWDTLVGNSSGIFWDQVQPSHPASVLLRRDPLRGAGLHCGVGSTANEPDAILDWLEYELGL